jgi:hypothetical protein
VKTELWLGYHVFAPGVRCFLTSAVDLFAHIGGIRCAASLKFRCIADVKKHLTEGYRAILRTSLRVATSLFKRLLYPDPRTSALPALAKIPPNTERNRDIYNRYVVGERAQKLADEFGISVRRVNWLINRFRQNTV